MTTATQTQNDFSEHIEQQNRPDWQPTFSRWRHGGWYVDNLHYPSGAVGCVSRNYTDKKWRIVCDPRPFEEQPTFPSRTAAAFGERELIAQKVRASAPEAERKFNAIVTESASSEEKHHAKLIISDTPTPATTQTHKFEPRFVSDTLAVPCRYCDLTETQHIMADGTGFQCQRCGHIRGIEDSIQQGGKLNCVYCTSPSPNDKPTTNTQEQHTATPWRVAELRRDVFTVMSDFRAIDGEDSEAICQTVTGYLGVDDPREAQANARFIVKAVNSHEKLVAALEGLSTAAKVLDDGLHAGLSVKGLSVEQSVLNDEINRARAALAEVQEA